MSNNQEVYIPLLIEDLGMLYPTISSKKKYRYGLYKCNCGKTFKTQTSSVARGKTKSCGCYKDSVLKERNTTHNLRFHPLNAVWNVMKQRCNNENNHSYKYYGKRGIQVCEEWLSDFINFYNWAMSNGYKKTLTIDRKDNDLGYDPNNCRFVKRTVQSRNTRRIISTNTSGYRGVSFSKRDNKFMVHVTICNKQKYLGSFKTAIEGARAYDTYVIENNLEHTTNGVLNV